MTTLTPRDAEHVFESLRKGLVPERGIDTFAVGIEKQRNEIERQLDLAENREGTIKFLRGGYGCGKTFMARLAMLDAQRRGFATSFVVVSDNDLKFYKFDDVYRKVVTELGTASCARGALGDVLDRWIGNVEDALIDASARTRMRRTSMPRSRSAWMRTSLRRPAGPSPRTSSASSRPCSG
jgi:hypothetical protein